MCIKRNREKHNLSLDSLSQKTGISLEILSQYESGEAEITITELKLISSAIEVPLLFLFEGGGMVETYYRDENGHPRCKWNEY